MVYVDVFSYYFASDMKLLDLYCGAGGASVGYHRAGFDVTGVDIKPQPNYPFEFIQSDVFDLTSEFIDGFDIIHASPPCQAYSWSARNHVNRGKVYPDLLDVTRDLLIKSDKPYIIENVIGAPMIRPITLCGTMFDLRVIRHRLFEIDAPVWVYPPCGCKHNGSVKTGEYLTVAGHGCDSITTKYSAQCDAMGINWMTKYELTQAIPPAYTEWIGKLIITNNGSNH